MFDHGYGYLWPVFWVSIWLVFGGFARYMRHRERMKALDTARVLAERGTSVPAEIAEALKPRWRCEGPDRDLRTGVVMLALSAAFVIFGAILSQGYPGRHGVYPLYGVAAFPGVLGLVFLGFWWFSRRPRA